MRLLRSVPVLLAVALAAAGCSSPTSSDDPRDLLDQNRRKFQALVGDDYRFDSEIVCFCTPDYRAPVRITVRRGAMVEVARLADGVVVPPEEWGTRYRTVEGVFDLIAKARAEGAHRVDVEYDGRYGYPAELFIDQDERIADEEFGLRLGGLEVLQP